MSPSSLSIQPVVPSSTGNLTRTEKQGTSYGLPWFEEMIEGSVLGRVSKTRKGVGKSADGSTTVEWEVTEWVDDGSGAEQAGGTSKRKIGELVEGEGVSGDVQMR